MCRKAWDRIVRLEADVDLTGFECGEPDLDLWLQRDAFEWQEESRCTVYLAVTGENEIVGFFSLSMYHLQSRAVKGAVDASGNIPAVLLGKFGVDKRFRGPNRESRGCGHQGTLLMREIIGKARLISKDIACRLLYVEALNDRLVPWYEKRGFTSLQNPRKMVLDLGRDPEA